MINVTAAKDFIVGSDVCVKCYKTAKYRCFKQYFGIPIYVCEDHLPWIKEWIKESERQDYSNSTNS